MTSGEVELVDLVKAFDDVVAVDHVSVTVRPGEFFSLLGPSGCGKTTTLRMIAGFERPTQGQIMLDGVDMAQTPPHRRQVNTVFQSYALFPHLNVFDNVAFGLRYKDAPKPAKEAVSEALARVRLEGMEKRRPSQLSGGQQQRVALARALVLDPAVLLLDEPLGALDAKLRKALQIELKGLQENLGITFIYVTHDQEEALTMSDRIAVMSDGRIEQVGSPQNVYEEPSTAYVADFLGTSNLMSGRSLGRNDGRGCVVQCGSTELEASGGDLGATGEVLLVIRPERIEVETRDAGQGGNRLPGKIERVVYVGASTQLIIRLGTGDTLQAMLPSGGRATAFDQGSPVSVHLPPEALRVLSPSTDTDPSEEGQVV
ncbi:MAG: putative spermidine/putrescine transport system ATP-binding protein [Actinomycetota bacterium]|jgi:spermidine/putrescine transport system ATP-binding protein|nr:putative spermidine/putrescine transport system ATP-binding protein [Actinomycetota bacterium]